MRSHTTEILYKACRLCRSDNDPCSSSLWKADNLLFIVLWIWTLKNAMYSQNGYTVLSRAPLYEAYIKCILCFLFGFVIRSGQFKCFIYNVSMPRDANRYCVSASRLVWFGFYTSVSTLINDRPLACVLL